MGIVSLAPQVRVSLDGKWLAWRPVTAAHSTWTVLALGAIEPGEERAEHTETTAVAYLTDQAVANWHALVAAAPLLADWNDEIRGCIGEQPVEACSECMGLALAISAVQRAAQL